MPQLTPDAIALEREYYLPPQNSDMEKEWAMTSDHQTDFAEYCRQGHLMVANAIIEGRRKGKMPSIMELYAVAARARRGMAAVGNDDDREYIGYGRPPLVDAYTDEYHILELIEPKSAPQYYKLEPKLNRYGEYYERALARFQALESDIASGEFSKKFGAEYHAEKNPYVQSPITIDITRAGHKIAQLIGGFEFVDPDAKPYIKLQHARLKEWDFIFKHADDRLKEIYKQVPPDPTQFWQRLGDISLDLYHAPPLRFGSQASTMMVLAGITKAMGFEVLPRTPEMDHFMDAELIPYKQYCEEYGSKFIRPPVQGKLPVVVYPVQDDFIAKGYEKTRQRKKDLNPQQRLNWYVNQTDKKLATVHVRSFEVKGKQITSLEIEPKEYADGIKRGLDFIGHGDIIDMLGLTQGKHYEAGIRR